MQVLLTDGNQKQTLAATRALARTGWTVDVASHRPRSPACFSRFCRRRLAYTDPASDREAFVSDVADHAERHGHDVVLPVGVATTVALSLARDRIEDHAVLAAPDADLLAKTHAKEETIRIAERAGVPVPETAVPDGADDLKALAEEVTYPVVVKSRKGSGVARTVLYASGPDELLSAYGRMTGREDVDDIHEFDRPMVQEFIPGKIHDVMTVMRRGEPRAAVTGVRLRTIPPEGGPGIVNETTDDDRLRDLALDLLGAIGYHGAAQVEFKLDPRDGEYNLMEVNPKLWGTLELAIASGVNVPDMVCRLFLDGDVAPQMDHRTGVRLFWPLPGGLQYVLASRDRREAVGEVLSFLGRPSRTDLRLGDPVPNLAQAAITARILVRWLGGDASYGPREDVPEDPIR